MEEIIRIFRCANGHEYKSKYPITTSWAEANTPKFLGLFGGVKANDSCKFCGAQIMSERDFVNGNCVMGAERMPDEMIIKNLIKDLKWKK